MILCIDVGNTTIHGGVFSDSSDKLKFQFRKTSPTQMSSDELGLFFKHVLRENNISPEEIKKISFCSVVPQIVYSLRNACKKYFGVQPFSLQAGVKTGLKIKYRNPLEVGADRISNALGALNLFPSKNFIIVDFGTATTVCVINSEKEYLGGTILPGIKISMEALETKTAKLPSVEIIRPLEVIARSTVESIQSGLYYGQIGTVKEIISKIYKNKIIPKENTIVLATGGFSNLFEKENVFDHIISDLCLKGLYYSLKINS